VTGRTEPAMLTRTYSVIGMTCGHCVATVTEELQALAGVTNVTVDLGTATVTGDVDAAAVAGALAAVGYRVAGTR
jgi:copper chaperone